MNTKQKIFLIFGIVIIVSSFSIMNYYPISGVFALCVGLGFFAYGKKCYLYGGIKMKKIKRYSWNDISESVKLIAESVRKSEKKFDFITGIPRGGLVLGVMLSHELDIPYIEFSAIKDKIQYHKILLVDDISDSGETFINALGFFYHSRTTTATIDYKPSSNFEPDMYANKVKDSIWVVYPWEKENSHPEE